MRGAAAQMARRAAYRKKRQNRMGMLLVTTVVLMMLLVVTVKSVELREKRATYMAKEETLMEEIEAEQARTEEIAEYEKYTQTKKYVEEVAKEKLGLVYDGEIIFKDEN
jgi:cell division protein DivIC